MIQIEDVRGDLLEIVSSLYELKHRVAALAQRLPLPPDVEQMWEAQIPSSALANLYSALEAVRSDCLEQGIATLLRAARQSDASLRSEFLSQRKNSRKSVNEIFQKFSLDPLSGREIRQRGGVSFPCTQPPGNAAGRKEPPPCSD